MPGTTTGHNDLGAAAGVGYTAAGPDSPVLITSNSRLTHDVLLAVLSTTTAPMWMLSVDTGGHTVDMSMVFKTLTPEAVATSIATQDRIPPDAAGRVILPGLAQGVAEPLAERLNRPVEVGPICVAELPLYFGSAWRA